MSEAVVRYPWLAGFSEEQVAAATHGSGHALVSAAPGSGKTKMVIGRCGVLLASGVKPSEILGLAFNTDAAKEVNSRLASLPLPAAKGLKFRTIHSFCKEVIEVAEEEGFLQKRELITSDYEISGLVRQALAGQGGNPYDVDELKTNAARQALTLAKANMIDIHEGLDPEELMGFAEGDKEVAEGVIRYEAMRVEAGIRGFDDLIYDLAMLFKKSPKAREWAGNEFAHIIVDEYQDVDDAQQCIIFALAGTRANLFVVGDEDQCIYGWRGSNLEYMNHAFESQLGSENVSRYELSLTFRYGHEIAVAANSLIRNNTDRPQKLCVSNASTPKSSLSLRMSATASGDRYWPQAVMEDINQWKSEGRKMRDAVVLVRTYELAAPLEMHLIRSRTPYVIEGRGILAMPEVKAINAYAVMSDPEMFEACGEEGKTEILTSVLSSPGMFLPKKIIERLSGSLANATLQDVPGALRQLSEVDGLRPYQISSLRKRAQFIESLSTSNFSMADLASTIWNGLEWRADVLRRIVDPLKQSDRLNVLNLMCREVARYESVEAMLDTFSQRMEQADQPEAMHDPLLITSIHKAKGLEWPLVIIPGMSEGQFPHKLPDTPVDMEAERRLAYVAITRAKERVILVAPNDLALANRWKIPVNPTASRKPEETADLTSRFLTELDPDCVRAARTWFYGDGKFPMVNDLMDYANKAGKPIPGAHNVSLGVLTTQPLATEAPKVGVQELDYDFGF
jgi:DNA helicase-2/ATP-dependent DNA helicase PcrA